MSNLEASPLLREAIRHNDALLITVSSLGAQRYVGQVQRVYSRRFEGPQPYDAGSLPFVGGPSTWGNKALDDGEHALVFLSYLSKSQRYYQHHWHGHFTLFDHQGELHALAHWRLLEVGHDSWGPKSLRDSAFLPDPSKPWQVALPFNLLEAHLFEELALVGC